MVAYLCFIISMLLRRIRIGQRLLHAGANTSDIITFYMSAVKVIGMILAPRRIEVVVPIIAC
jgi:hypothetical protein